MSNEELFKQLVWSVFPFTNIEVQEGTGLFNGDIRVYCDFFYKGEQYRITKMMRKCLFNDSDFVKHEARNIISDISKVLRDLYIRSSEK